jgi:hypothetical protein
MLRIQINPSTLVDDLQEALASAGCATARAGETTLLVSDPLGEEAQTKPELAFFLKAWKASRPGAEIELVG